MCVCVCVWVRARALASDIMRENRENNGKQIKMKIKWKRKKEILWMTNGYLFDYLSLYLKKKKEDIWEFIGFCMKNGKVFFRM